MNRFDEPDLCLTACRKYGDTTWQGHIQAHISRQNFCGLHRIADFEHLALIIKRDAFIAKRGSQIVNVQDTEPMAYNRCLKVRGRLSNDFVVSTM